MSWYYDIDGTPLTMEQWAGMVERQTKKRVAQSKAWFGLVWVSTVWLGMDHDFTWTDFTRPNPNPVIFETMVFIKGQGGGWLQRYSTLAQAQAGHKQVMRRLRNPFWLFKIWKAGN